MIKRTVPGFDPAGEDWVMVDAKAFVFEPIGAEFVPPAPGPVVVRFGKGSDRHRGVEVSVLDGGWASVWTPVGATAFWLPDPSEDQVTAPWETRLKEVDHERGRLK